MKLKRLNRTWKWACLDNKQSGSQNIRINRATPILWRAEKDKSSYWSDSLGPEVRRSTEEKRGKEQAASIFQLRLMEELSVAKITRPLVPLFFSASSSWAKCNPWSASAKAIRPEQEHLLGCLWTLCTLTTAPGFKKRHALPYARTLPRSRRGYEVLLLSSPFRGGETTTCECWWKMK